MKREHYRNLQRRPSIPMKSGQKSSSPIAVAGNLGPPNCQFRKSAPLEYYCASASGLDVAGLGNGTLTSDERIRRKFEEQ